MPTVQFWVPFRLAATWPAFIQILIQLLNDFINMEVLHALISQQGMYKLCNVHSRLEKLIFLTWKFCTCSVALMWRLTWDLGRLMATMPFSLVHISSLVGLDHLAYFWWERSSINWNLLHHQLVEVELLIMSMASMKR